METCRDNPNLVKMGQKYRALYMKIQITFFVAREIKSP